MFKKAEINKSIAPIVEEKFEMGFKGGEFTLTKHLLCANFFTHTVFLVLYNSALFSKRKQVPDRPSHSSKVTALPVKCK